MLQPRPPLDAGRVRSAFASASDAFLATVREVRDWDAPGLGVWNVRELVAHVLRAYSTIETYLDAEPSSADIIDATAYYRIALSAPSIHEAVAERGREGARALTDPVPQSEEIARRLRALVDTTSDERLVENFAGRLPFPEYLATRVIELGLHTLDLQQAIGVTSSLPDDVSSLCLDLLQSLATEVDLLRAITGRGTTNVLG